MIRAILAGQERGNKESQYWLDRFIRFIDARVYVGSTKEWKGFELKHDFIQTDEVLNNTIFEQSEHDHKDRYIKQWSALYQTYNTIKDTFDNDDIIIKIRNDLHIFTVALEMPEVKEGEIWVPEKEFHMNEPFNKDIVCNDQIVMGTKSAMDIYFNLPYEYEWLTQKNACIEEILRMYLHQKGLELKTFKLNYTKCA
jgi:hypothetical protein